MSIKATIIFILIMFGSTTLAKADLSGRIYFHPDSGRKEIDFGPCYIGDFVYASFVLKNTGNETLRMLGVSPSIESYASPNAITAFEYLKFSPVSPSLPFNLTYNTRMSDTLVMRYRADLDTIAEPLGRKEAMLRLGLVNPMDTTQVVVQDTFKMIARKTIRFVEGFQEQINFDSVLINSSIKTSAEFKVRNTQNVSLPVVSAKDSLMSQQGSFTEFFFEQKNFPIVILPKKSAVSWEIEYKPRDLGGDTALFKVFFIPKPDTKPDSTDFCYMKATGTGVSQKIVIDKANATFSNDTVFLGDVPIVAGKELELVLSNAGNLPFGARGQYFQDALTGLEYEDFTLTKSFLFGKGHLKTNSKDTARIEVNPTKRGYFTVKYIIDSDIANRKVTGWQDNDTRLTFYIAGRAVEPEIKTNADTIDFGNVVYSGDLFGDCPSRKDTVLRIANVGNMELNINDILLDDDFNFSVSERELVIDENSEKGILLSFHSSYPLTEYFAKLRIVSNSTSPKDTLTVVLRAQSVLPVLADLSIPDDLKAKPGTIFNVPIFLKNEYYAPAVYASFYELDLSYNPTLLKYDGRQTISTASEGAVVEVQQTARGQLKLKVSGTANLLPRDTLILLRFKAYLGDNESTEIALQNPLFGSGNCKRVLDTRITNGRFALDSVCGLPFKIGSFNLDRASIIGVYPNPANEKINIEYFVPSEESVKFNIFNSYGSSILTIGDDHSEAGVNSLPVELGDLPTGVYFIEIQNGKGKEIKSFIIRK